MMTQRRSMDGSNASLFDDNDVSRDAAGREEMALRLTLETMRQAQRAVVGIFALPASIALGVAASVSYAAAFLERGFETFERSLGRIARDTQELTTMSQQKSLEPNFAGPLPAGDTVDKPGKSVRS